MSSATTDHWANVIIGAQKAANASLLLDVARDLNARGSARGMGLRAAALGFADEIQRNFDSALEHFQHSLALRDELGEEILMLVLLSVGNIHVLTGHNLGALDAWQQLLAFHMHHDDRAGTARMLGKIGLIHHQVGNHNDALEYLERSHALYEELGDHVGAARLSSDIGVVDYQTGHYSEARARWERSLRVFEEHGDNVSAARVSGNIGNVYHSTGDYAMAIEHFHRALILHEQHNEHRSIALITRNLGNAYRSTGNYAVALEHFHRALERYEVLGNRRGVAQSLCSIGLVYYDTGDYPNALSYLHRSLALHEELGDQSGIAHVTDIIGGVHSYTGDYASAQDYLQRALALHTIAGDRASLARVIGSMGLVYANTGNQALALEHYERSLALHLEIGSMSSVARVTGSIIRVLVESGSIAEAEAMMATMDAMTIDDPGVRISRDTMRALILQHQGKYEDAMTALHATLRSAQTLGLPAEESELRRYLRDLCEVRNDLHGYIEHNKEHTRINAEINNSDTSRKLALQEKQREIDAVHREHQQHMTVLHSTLPRHIADRVAKGEKVTDEHDNTGILFLDIVGFTTNSSALDAGSVVDLLQIIFTAFDAICGEHNVVKIKTIGDAYMAVAFPSEHHILNLASAALAMMSSTFVWPHSNVRVQFRIGMHVGHVIAGILGTQRLQYDVWGDTVNVASRMESTGEPGRVHVSSSFADVVRGERDFNLVPRGEVDIKGKGLMTTFWMEASREYRLDH